MRFDNREDAASQPYVDVASNGRVREEVHVYREILRKRRQLAARHAGRVS